MRLAAYAGTSVALAAGIVLKALHSRPNFYSVSVYFAESNAALMILSNLILLVLGSILVGLQHVLYGPLRPIEIEQLYEKAWFAVTETCLAMTIFREELGVWFVVMFVSLLVAKVWGWIGEGRLEILEQQPPENPRLFHARLSASLILSMIFNAWLLNYSVDTVRQTNRPNMMVMFAFEFALLNVSSLSTLARYGIIVQEALIVRDQTKTALQGRKKEIEDQRKAARDAAAEAGEPAPEEPPLEEILDEADIDVPGWEEKSRWIFYLDLTTDFLRLLLYVTFFCVLCRLYGMPIHIIRDVALVIRSFYRRVTDFIKYRHATRDMHARYPDATEEEITSQDVCIICREGMRARPEAAAQAQAEAAPLSPLDERLRPKKLPCGHILHFACLRSWLERQQNCPTCRQPVLSSPTITRSANPQNPANNPAGGAPAMANNNNNQAPQANLNQPNAQLNRMRTFNLGPLRLTVGTGQIVRAPQPGANGPNTGPNAVPAAATSRNQPGTGNAETAHPTGLTDSNGSGIQTNILSLETAIMQESARLRLQSEQLNVLRSMQVELARLRHQQAMQHHRLHIQQVQHEHQLRHLQQTQQSIPGMTGASLPPTFAATIPQMSVFSAGANSEQLPAGNSNLPAGVTIPDGWTLLPLQRMPETGGLQPMSVPTMMVPGEQRSRSVGPSRQFIPTAIVPTPANSSTQTAQRSSTTENAPTQAPASTGSPSAPVVASNPTQHRTGSTENSQHVTASVTQRESQPTPLQGTSGQTSSTTVTDPAASSTNNWQWPSSPPVPTPTSASLEAKVEGSGISQQASSPSATTSGESAQKDHVTTVEDVPDEEIEH